MLASVVVQIRIIHLEINKLLLYCYFDYKINYQNNCSITALVRTSCRFDF